MDCQTANEYINAYADNMLNKKETEQLLSHISSCSKCKKDFDDVIAIKKALAGLGEKEPPAGLALSAIKKARKRRIPVFAYASAGIAAAIALVAVFSSGIFNNNSYDGGVRNAAPAAYSKSETGADMEMQAAEATAAPMSDFALAPEAPSTATSVNDATGATLGGTHKASVPYINVPAENSEDFRQALKEYLDDNNIGYHNYETRSGDTVWFTIAEDKLDSLKALIEKLLHYNEELKAGTINFIFSK